MDMKRYAEYGVLSDREANLKAELKEVSERRRRLGEELIDEMADNGLAKLTVKVGTDMEGRPVNKTLYVQRLLYAGHRGDKAALIEGLKQAGFEDLVGETVNAQTLSALVREFDPENNMPVDEIIQAMPQPMHDVLKVTEKIELRARKA